MDDVARKRLIIHLGPHKTGSTAIQKWLLKNSTFLEESGVHFAHSELTHKAATLISQEKYAEAEEVLSRIRGKLDESKFNTFIISQEDFSGALPGRSKGSKIYGRITKNVRLLARTFRAYDLSFAFFVRDENDWLKSCYVQNLKHRSRFSSLEDFIQSLQIPVDWSTMLQKARDSVKCPFHVLQYSKGYPDNGIKLLLKILGLNALTLPSPVTLDNQSPSAQEIRAMERINKLSSFPSTAWLAKRQVVGNAQSAASTDTPLSGGPANLAFPELAARAVNRFSRQPAEDILPDVDTDLAIYANKLIPSTTELVPGSREDIRIQGEILRYHLRGKSELAWLNALAISYLRRDTPHTVKASTLFHRIWDEERFTLVNELGTRWLISTMQTFLDHGKNENQRMVGAAGFFYANLMKIYEGERALEGLDQQSSAHSPIPRTKNKFRGLDRYKVGGTDLLLNTNVIALEIASRDEVAGLVLVEFLLRVKNSGNVFTRLDSARSQQNIEIPGFEDTWSFFVSPKVRDD